jgi:hypothetical protein
VPKGRKVKLAGLVARHTRLREDPLGDGSNVLASSDLASICGLCSTQSGDTILAGILRKSCGRRTPSLFIANANW